MKNMKSAETFKNAIQKEGFLSAREARREILGNLRRNVSDLSVSQPLDKYPFGCPQEKTIACGELCRKMFNIVLSGILPLKKVSM